MPEITTRMTADTSDFERKMKRAQETAKQTSSGITTGFKNVQSSFGKIIGLASKTTIALGAISGAAALLEGKNIDQMRYSFEKLAASFETGAEDMMDALRKASHGMVSDFELMQAASKGMILGLRPDAIVKFMEVAAASSKATGQTMTEAFSDITIGTARMSKLILDNLGIIVDADGAYKKYAATLGIAQSELTDTMKAQAFQNAVMEAGNRQIEILGNTTEGQLAETAKLLTTITNAWDAFTTGALKAFNAVAGVINTMLTWFGDVQQMMGITVEQTKELEAATQKVGFRDEVIPYMTSPLNGNGVKARQDQAKLQEERAKELEKTLKEINKIIEEATITESQRLDKWYEERLGKIQGNHEAELELKKAYELKKEEIDLTVRENNRALLDEQRTELLTRREQELTDLEDWYSRIQEVDSMSNEMRLEAEQIYRERKLAINEEYNNKEKESLGRLASEEARLAREKTREEDRQHRIRLTGLMAFGDLSLKYGGELGEKLFVASRSVAAAEAVVSTHAAVMKTMAATPYPWNIPLAAAQAAIGAAEVAAIMGTAIGSSSVGATAGGGGGAAPPTRDITDITPTVTQPEPEKKGTYTINIQGDIMNEDYVDLLAEKISEAVQDRNVILKASEARVIYG